ncbi:MAG: protein kinase [Deltaproteobacteria bacterium]|nr:protein kinase [Deltaproteobacteria bacterium]
MERLAVGGMAEIFLACEKGAHGLERMVVIKRILPTLAEDESFVEMFLQEARVAAGIHHPNVVAIHELGESDGYPYMALEYVAGSTMR